MEAISQVVLRNEARLTGESLLVVNPPRDMLAQRLESNNREVRLLDTGLRRFSLAGGSGIPRLIRTCAGR